MQKPIFTTTIAAIAILAAASPAHARFLQVDPVGYEDQQNLYAYVHNDPINGVDPTGECTYDTEGNAVSGVCGTDEVSQALVNVQIADPTSELAQTEDLANATGNMVNLTYDPNATARDASYFGFYQDEDLGYVPATITVGADTPGLALGVDGQNITMTTADQIEHEAARHFGDQIMGVSGRSGVIEANGRVVTEDVVELGGNLGGLGEASAINGENRRRTRQNARNPSGPQRPLRGRYRPR